MKWLGLLALAACFPYERTTVRTTARVIDAGDANEAGALVLHAETYEGVVVVTAAWPRTCRREIRDTVETTVDRHAELVGTQDNAVLAALDVPLMVLFWPVGLPDVIISEVVAAAAGTTTRADLASGRLLTPCPVRASGIPVHVTLASGRQLDGTTDEHGELALLLPPAEPTAPIVLRSDAKRPQEVAAEPQQPTPAPPPRVLPPAPQPAILTPPGDVEPIPQGFAGVRAAGVSCGLAGTVTFDITIAADGHVARLAAVGHAEAAACLGHVITDLHFSPHAEAQHLTIPFLLRRQP
jgi:hypothetical protein